MFLLTVLLSVATSLLTVAVLIDREVCNFLDLEDFIGVGLLIDRVVNKLIDRGLLIDREDLLLTVVDLIDRGGSY